MGFDDGPDPLPLGFFEPFRREAEPGGQPLFALNPLAELVVGFHPSRLSTVPTAVQQTGRLMPGFWSDAPHAPYIVRQRERPGGWCPRAALLFRGRSQLNL